MCIPSTSIPPSVETMQEAKLGVRGVIVLQRQATPLVKSMLRRTLMRSMMRIGSSTLSKSINRFILSILLLFYLAGVLRLVHRWLSHKDAWGVRWQMCTGYDVVGAGFLGSNCKIFSFSGSGEAQLC